MKEVVCERSDTGCLEVVSHKTSDGYPRILVRGRATLLHRFVWTSLYGDPPPGMCVCHTCDNRRCIEPTHLFLGTRRDNNRDRHEKGRDGSHRGELNGNARLTRDDVVKIRQIAGHADIKAIAKQYGISPFTVYQIRSGRIWSHVN